MGKLKIQVSEAELLKIEEWYAKFQQADRIKKLAYSLRYQVDNSTLDKRVNFAWETVKRLEPVPTFKNGVLTEKAKYLLNCMKLQKVFKTDIFVIN